MHKKVKHIAIVGGGTSAWFSAAYLARNTDHKITVIDKEIGSPVGVGEGTLLGFEEFLKDCGFETKEWFDEIDATYKSGIMFPQFGGNDNLVWHPFILNIEYPQYNSNLYEALTHGETGNINSKSAFFDISVLNKVDLENLNQYAMHVDCSKLVQWIQKKIIDHIDFVKSEVIDITRDNSGNINELKLNNGNTIQADFFLDCTGFKQLLQPNPNRITLENRLFCDTALAGHVPYKDVEKECRPFVESHAVEHGWIWKIPVRTRIGSGLVFNRSVTDPQEAAEFFSKYWEGRIKPDDLKLIDWTPYYNKNMWDKNVLGIGLSAGFIEPLESTGLGTITNALRHFTRFIIPGYYNEYDINLFNSTMTALYEETIDFINMHYVYSDYDSKFWKWVKDTIVPSDIYKHYKEMINNGEKLNNQGKAHFFGGANWLCWMLQIEKNIAPTKELPYSDARRIISEWEETQQIAFNKPNTVPHLMALKKGPHNGNTGTETGTGR